MVQQLRRQYNTYNTAKRYQGTSIHTLTQSRVMVNLTRADWHMHGAPWHIHHDNISLWAGIYALL